MSRDPAYEAYNGVRLALPNGKMLVAKKPIYFADAMRLLELLDRFNRGEPFDQTLKPVLVEWPKLAEIEDLSPLYDLTMGEVVDTVYRFFGHRPTRATPSSPPSSPTSPPPAGATAPDAPVR